MLARTLLGNNVGWHWKYCVIGKAMEKFPLPSFPPGPIEAMELAVYRLKNKLLSAAKRRGLIDRQPTREQ